jgi:hypothetical protein
MSRASTAKRHAHGRNRGSGVEFPRTPPCSGHPQISGTVVDANEFAPFGFGAVELPRIQISKHAEIMQAPKSSSTFVLRWQLAMHVGEAQPGASRHPAAPISI